jgi:hypothetical protein
MTMMYGRAGLTKAKRKGQGAYYGLLTNIPPRLQKEAQKALWHSDPAADIIFELPMDEMFRVSAVNAAKSAAASLRAIRKNLRIEEPVYYCITASPQIQACAFLLAGRYRCIALWMGGLIINQGNLNRLAVMPSLASHFLLPSRPEVALTATEGDDTYTAFQRSRLPYPIKAASKHERAVVLALSAHLMAFIIWHEMGHALNGHLFLRKEVPSALIQETHERGAVGQGDQLTSHVLEWDADTFAAIRAFGNAFQTKLDVEDYYRFDSFEQRLGFRTFLAMLAIYVACRLFQARPIAPESALREKHPPGAVRLLLMLPQAKQAWSQIPETQGYAFPARALRDAVRLCETAIGEMTGVATRDFDLVATIPPNWFAGYQGRLLQRWAELYPTLAANKIGRHELPHPDETEPWDLSDLFAAK